MAEIGELRFKIACPVHIGYSVCQFVRVDHSILPHPFSSCTSPLFWVLGVGLGFFLGAWSSFCFSISGSSSSPSDLWSVSTWESGPPPITRVPNSVLCTSLFVELCGKIARTSIKDKICQASLLLHNRSCLVDRVDSFSTRFNMSEVISFWKHSLNFLFGMLQTRDAFRRRRHLVRVRFTLSSFETAQPLGFA